MSTTIVTTWATDVAQLGPVYPFVGSEFILWILALVFWLGFHFLQSRAESKALKEEEAGASSHQDLLRHNLTRETQTKN